MTLVTVGLIVAAAIFAMWLLYTIIWRAVRRGMREFEDAQWERDQEQEQDGEPELRGSAVVHQRGHLHLPVRRRVPDDGDPLDVVPDYPPAEWF